MDQPNIVFLHVDQMHHDVIAAYGNPHVYTPNMDRLVREKVHRSCLLTVPCLNAVLPGHVGTPAGCRRNTA